MITRRMFLRSGLLAAAVAGSAPWVDVRAVAESCSTLGVVTDTGCGGCNLFLRAFSTEPALIEIDAGEYVQEISAALDGLDFDLFVGLTRESDAIIAHQLAAERGYERVYLGAHRRWTESLHHRCLSMRTGRPMHLASWAFLRQR